MKCCFGAFLPSVCAEFFGVEVKPQSAMKFDEIIMTRKMHIEPSALVGRMSL
jgi:hypothetical protein